MLTHRNQLSWAFAIVIALIPTLGRFEYPKFKKTHEACLEFKTSIGDECKNAYPPKDGLTSLCDDANEDEYHRFMLSLANNMFLGCDSWCVYDITDDAATAYMWNSDKSCWLPSHQWLCFQAQEERRDVQAKMTKVCHFDYQNACHGHADVFLQPTHANDECIELATIDPVNEPDRYNRVLRCRCDTNDDFGEKAVIRRERTAVHCKEEPWSKSTRRIELALLNGMYMNCENWCLFDIFEPNRIYWEWNPWKECWDDKTEEGICDKVVSEYWDEAVFAQKRANSFCEPQNSPLSGIDFTWRPSDLGKDCIETCLNKVGENSQCSARAMVAVNNDADKEFIKAAFLEAGVICNSISFGDNGVTGTPAHRDDHCVTTSGSSEPGLRYCKRPISSPYMRLCACTI